MTLQRPRRWLGYQILLNDQLEQASAILDRFESSEVPLDDTFGSNRGYGRPPRFKVGVGLGVEVPRLAEVLKLLSGLPVEMLSLDLASVSHKKIYIGGYSVKGYPEAPLTEELRARVLSGELSAPDLHELIRSNASFRVIKS